MRERECKSNPVTVTTVVRISYVPDPVEEDIQKDI